MTETEGKKHWNVDNFRVVVHPEELIVGARVGFDWNDATEMTFILASKQP